MKIEHLIVNPAEPLEEEAPPVVPLEEIPMWLSLLVSIVFGSIAAIAVIGALVLWSSF